MDSPRSARRRRRRTLTNAAALAVLATCVSGWAPCPALAGGREPSCQILARPGELYEGRPFEIAVAYDLPPSLGQVQLHCEVKTTEHVVVQSEIALVEGKGARRFRLTTPSRRRARRVIVAAWLGDDWRRALSPIQFTPPIPVYSKEALGMKETERAAAPAILRRLGHARSPRGNVAILSDAAFGANPDLASQLGGAIRQQGPNPPAVTLVDAASLTNRFVVNAGHFDLLILTEARTIPARALRTICRFLRDGGDLIAIGTPAFQRIVHRVDGKWLDADQIRELLWSTEPERLLFDFGRADLTGWKRATNRQEPKATYEVVRGGKTGRCLRGRIPSLTGWDTYGSPPLDHPFPKGHTLTCFWAKGSKRTREVAIEWAERDGSRWIATVPLSTTWRHYALTPQEFRYWRDNPAKNRGGAEDCLNPANASRIVFGLAFTHTHVPPGEHTFWIDEVGTAPNPHPRLTRLTADRPDELTLDTLCPGYKFYPITSGRRFAISDRQAIVPPTNVPRPRTPQSSHVRPQATGCDKKRPWRWVPLIEAVDRHGRRCGFPATLLVHAAQPFERSAWAAFSYTPSEVRRSKALRSTIAALARRMLEGVFLLEGGSRWYTVFDDQTVALGATAANFARRDTELTVTFRVTPAKGKEPVFERRFSATLAPGKQCSWRATWSQPGFRDAPYRVETTLEREGRVIDRLSHELHVWRPKKKPLFMTTKGLDFYLGGKKWYPHGVNYMPSSGIGIENGAYFEYWLDGFPYDPDVVQTDLERIVEAGMNTVSIFIYSRSIDSGNLLDILRRCEALGLKVDLSLRPGTPLDFRWDEMRAIIERYRLKRNDTVFAYDLAWEPHFRNHQARVRHNTGWQRWIIERYGSIENAERDWGVPCARQGGKITNPSDRQVSADGPWRVMVAAYRRFLDDLLAEHYSRARRLVRSIDPNHLVSFRMTIAGDPTISHSWTIPYDFRATAHGVDIVCPEGYGRIGEWDRVRPGAFTVAYARCVAPSRPLMWAEFGRSVWDRRRGRPDPDTIEWAAGYYERFYKMALLSESSGTVCWWYPGGFRVGENSDYGIINPDGSDRPITRVIRRYAREFTRPRRRSATTHWITIDRDAHAGGLPAIYQAVEKEFWQAIDAGKFPGLRHIGQGTTSADCPLLAVGNVPYNGHNPPKCLNAIFTEVRVKNRKGEWQEIRPGDTVVVPRGRPVEARVALANTGFAAWLTPKGRTDKGCVYLTVQRAGRAEALFPIPADVAYLGDANFGELELLRRITQPTQLTLEMVAKGRMRFGQKLSLTLRPAD